MGYYDPQYNRNKYGNYNADDYFIAQVGGTDAYFLEDEYNQMQKMLNEARADILKNKFHSGFLKKSNIDDISVFQEGSGFCDLFVFDQSEVIVNGYKFSVSGNLGFLNDGTIIKSPTFNNVKLPSPPSNGYRDDFVFLEMWFSEVKHDSQIWYHGNKYNFNGLIENKIFDPRINGETCRKIQLQWAIRVAQGVNFSINSYGFDSVPSNSIVKPQGNQENLSDYPFYPLMTQSVNRDNGIWRAGMGTMNDMGTVDGYVYAIPLFRVKRRNVAGYSEENINGSNLYDNSSEFNYCTRPDGKFANIVYKEDIVDLRLVLNDKTNFKNILNRNFNKLMVGELEPYEKIGMIKEQFGVEPFIVDSDTKLYVDFNKKISGATASGVINPIAQGTVVSEYTYGAEQQGLLFKETNQGYLSYVINSVNDSFGTLSTIIKFFNYIENGVIWKIKFSNNKFISMEIKNGSIIIIDSENNEYCNVYLQDKFINHNEFHNFMFVWDKNGTQTIRLIVDNAECFVSEIINSDLFINIASINIGDDSAYMKNVIIDEFYYTKRLIEKSYVIPDDVCTGYAKISIDPIKSRGSYLNVPCKKWMVQHLEESTTDNSGNVTIEFETPFGIVFTETTPKLYYDNEASLAVVNWSGLGTNHITGIVSGLGSQIEYNFVLVYEAELIGNCGLSYLPKKMYYAQGERIIDKFQPVRADMSKEEYKIRKIFKNGAHYVNNISNKMTVYQPKTQQKRGFGVGIDYYFEANGSDFITIPKSLYGNDIIFIYDVSVDDEEQYKNILQSFIITETGITLSLTKSVYSGAQLHIVVATDQPTVVYDYKASGIDGFYTCEKTEFTGDGIKKKFCVRYENLAIDASGAILNGENKFFAMLNGVPVPVSANFIDTFIEFTFTNAPVNKGKIVFYALIEYEPMRSERFKVWYDAESYGGIKDIEYIKTLNNAEILEDFDSIFAFTEGVSKSQNIDYNKKSISVVYLPSTNNFDYQLSPSINNISYNPINMKLNINYASPNTQDNNDYLPILDKLKINNLNIKQCYRGFMGNVSIGERSYYSNIQTTFNTNWNINTPHLNAIPFLIKDLEGVLKLGVISTFSTLNNLMIDGNNNQSAIGIFDLDEKYIIK